MPPRDLPKCLDAKVSVPGGSFPSMGRKYDEKYTYELLTEAAAKSVSIVGVLRYLEIPWSGGMHAHISRRLKAFGIDTSHFRRVAPNRGLPSPRRLTPREILVVRPPGSPRQKPGTLRRSLLEAGVQYLCSKCGVESEWQDEPLTLHVDHINGDWLDNRCGNLRFLCPNCHSQTSNFAGRSKGAVAQRQRHSV